MRENLILQREQNEAIINQKKVVYNTYFVEILGVKVELKPKDNTSKQLLELAFKEK